MDAALALLIDPDDGEALEEVSKRRFREGEQRLLLAMLENATDDYQKYAFALDKRGKELFCEAEEWILETNSDSLFSFESICEHLQLHPGYIRQGLLRWKAARLNSRHKQ